MNFHMVNSSWIFSDHCQLFCFFWYSLELYLKYGRCIQSNTTYGMIHVSREIDNRLLYISCLYLFLALYTCLMNFSAYSNTVKLFDVNIPKNANHLECLDGIRFLSISWVVLGHTLSNVIQYFSITDVSFVSRVNICSLNP